MTKKRSITMIKNLKDTDLTDMLAEEAFPIDDKIRDRFAWGHGEYESEKQVIWKLGSIIRKESSDMFRVVGCGDGRERTLYKGNDCFYGWFLDMPADFVRHHSLLLFNNYDKKIIYRVTRYDEPEGYAFQLDSSDYSF